MTSPALNARAGRAQVGASQPGLARPAGDFLVTSPEATRALLSVERFPGTVWEPAAGDGTMVRELERDRSVERVVASDVADHGCPGAVIQDFLTSVEAPGAIEFDYVVTNPPYEKAEAFVQRALDFKPTKVAMLLRTVWLEGVGRHERLWSRNPPARVWVFSRRPTFQRNGEGLFLSGLISFAWFVWDRHHTGRPELGWLP